MSWVAVMLMGVSSLGHVSEEAPYQKSIRVYLEARQRPFTIEAWHKPQPLAGMVEITQTDEAAGMF